MTNEAVFFLHVLIVLSAVVFAARMGRIWLVSLMCAMLVLMNVFVMKQMRLFGMDVTGGNVLYAAVFLTTDILAEHHGKKAAYRAVRIGFFVSIFFVLMSQTILLYAPNAFDAELDGQPTLGAHAAMNRLFSLSWRIVGASMVSYLIVQHLDVWLYGFWRRATKGRFLWLRNNASTWVSQFVDTIVFTVLAFAGTGFPIFNMIVFTYIVKIVVAAIDTPFLYLTKTRLLAPCDAALETD
ncbi:queuosine precursor transporter [Candidatus Sumerlaeota bacterium]|nr:queuosine precursor transporter [Candidatus Sumerlaeota bacterium]